MEETVLSVSITSKKDFKVLDPFAGSGTTLLACDRLGAVSYGCEPHPLIYEVAAGKLLWASDAERFLQTANNILELAKSDYSVIGEYPATVLKCYDENNLAEIDHLKKALNFYAYEESSSYTLSWLAFVSMLRASSHAGTATWQYILPNKKRLR